MTDDVRSESIAYFHVKQEDGKTEQQWALEVADLYVSVLKIKKIMTIFMMLKDEKLLFKHFYRSPYSRPRKSHVNILCFSKQKCPEKL